MSVLAGVGSTLPGWISETRALGALAVLALIGGVMLRLVGGARLVWTDVAQLASPSAQPIARRISSSSNA